LAPVALGHEDDTEGRVSRITTPEPVVRISHYLHEHPDELTKALDEVYVVRCECGRQETVTGADLETGRITQCEACERKTLNT
jgi:hypothetical protein